MNHPTIRVRFAPAPTGMMHLGNVRTALINYLYARQKNGVFIIRIEDTDAERNFDPKAEQIIADLSWLGLTYNEGPQVGGPHAPYFQSQRDTLYKEKLAQIIKTGKAYRCFCSPEELDKKRERQIALKQPPRYDRLCLKYSDAQIQQRLEAGDLYIWRFKFDQDQTLTITDLAHGTMKFEAKNFSDFPLTRSNGDVTFMFANCVDDIDMQITHVFRGEDHLTNTAGQAALFHAFNKPLPIYWHMPIICNIDGKKLSKRDFGFSLLDLKNAGFAHEAICNYLAIIGASFEQEFMSMDELIKTVNLDTPNANGHIRYDVEKLTWLNHKWINHYNPQALTDACLPFLQKAYPDKVMDTATLTHMLQILKTDMKTFADSVTVTYFYFERPSITSHDIASCVNADTIERLKEIIVNQPDTDAQQLSTHWKENAKRNNVPLKELFWFLRLALMGSKNGPAIHELIEILGQKESFERINHALSLV